MAGVNKTLLTETDIISKFILPAVKDAGWDDLAQIRQEVKLRDGKIVVRGKQLGRLFEVENGEPQLAVPFVDTCAAPDDLFKFSHRLDVLIQYDQLAGLRINAGCHQL